jgi:hypothetical protein
MSHSARLRRMGRPTRSANLFTKYREIPAIIRIAVVCGGGVRCGRVSSHLDRQLFVLYLQVGIQGPPLRAGCSSQGRTDSGGIRDCSRCAAARLRCRTVVHRVIVRVRGTSHVIGPPQEPFSSDPMDKGTLAIGRPARRVPTSSAPARAGQGRCPGVFRSRAHRPGPLSRRLPFPSEGEAWENTASQV